MIEQIIDNIINTTLNSFDIPFCITANIATYLVITTINSINHKIVKGIWPKRVIFLIVSFIIGAFYCYTNTDYKVIFNSIIIAPVSWSWIFKPICAKLDIDYKANINKDKD